MGFPASQEPVPGQQPDKRYQPYDQKEEFPTVAAEKVRTQPTDEGRAQTNSGQIDSGDFATLAIRKPIGAGAGRCRKCNCLSGARGDAQTKQRGHAHAESSEGRSQRPKNKSQRIRTPDPKAIDDPTGGHLHKSVNPKEG